MTAINDVKFENGVFSIKISQKNYKSELKKDDIQKEISSDEINIKEALK